MGAADIQAILESTRLKERRDRHSLPMAYLTTLRKNMKDPSVLPSAFPADAQAAVHATHFATFDIFSLPSRVELIYRFKPRRVSKVVNKEAPR